MHMKSSDEILVERAKAGDRTAFGELVAAHYDLIFRLSFRLLGSQAEAEDLAQDVCIELPVKLQSFRGESKFTTWLHRVVINKGRDVMRRKATHARAAVGWGDVEVLRHAADAETKAEIHWLQEAIGHLPQELQETLALVLGEEMTHAEAGACLSVSEGTISWRMSEVRKALKKQARSEEKLQ
ncbi:MAG: RNA polymerase sigma factor [Hyphomicrobiales bacterium]